MTTVWKNLAMLVDKYCTFPAIEKVKLFRLSIFNYLVGNEDMHLKNYSIITQDDKIELSPSYDLLSTSIALTNPQEEIALPLNGKKSKLNKTDLIEYWGKQKLKLSEKSIGNTLELIIASFDKWNKLIEISFLSPVMKDKYFQLLENRKAILQ